MARISVFMVDDNPIVLRFAARFLDSSPGISVAGTATDAADALTQVLGLQPEVVVVDLRMPGMSGFELIPRLRAALPGVGLVALTVLDADAYRQAALSAGADGFVTKGTMVAELVPTIQRVARSEGRPQTPTP